MKLRKLNSGLYPIVIALLTLFVIPACNNSDKEEKSSTTTSGTSINDSMAEDTSKIDVKTSDPSGPAKTTTTTTTAKKAGKVYARPIVADANAKSEMDKAGLSNYPDVMPVYPGGQTALDNYIANNI